MPEKFVSLEDQKAWETYQRVRLQMETPENIGRVMVVDTDTGDYAIDDGGLGRHVGRKPVAAAMTGVYHDMV